MRTISSNYLKMLFKACVERGGDERLLAELIPEGKRDLNNPSKRFDSRLAPTLLNETVKITGNQSLGVMIGTTIRPSTFLDLGYALPFCNDLREVTKMNETYQALVQQIGTTHLYMENGSAWKEWRPSYLDAEFYRYYVEMLFAGYASIGRWLLWGEDNPVLSIHFRHSAPENTDLHKQVFCKNITFGAPKDCVEFISHTVDVPMPNRDPDMLQFLKAKLDTQLAELGTPISIVSETLRYIQETLPDKRPPIEDAAAVIGMSVRSQRRKLNAHGESYRSIIERARRDACETYMGSGKHSQSEIALMLGFSDHSTYSRAFKTWYGKTPRAFKADCSQAEAG